jgi:hypothetical protein
MISRLRRSHETGIDFGGYSAGLFPEDPCPARASQVHGAYMAALGAVYAKIMSADEMFRNV